MDRLQAISENLPLRLVPLQIAPANPMLRRSSSVFRAGADSVQEAAIAVWNYEIEARFDAKLRKMSIADVPLHPTVATVA